MLFVSPENDQPDIGERSDEKRKIHSLKSYDKKKVKRKKKRVNKL